MPEDHYIHALLEASAGRFPDAPFLLFHERSHSYREVNAAADAVKQALLDCGVGMSDRVVICTHKSPAAVSCIFGILKAGAAYVPVDANAPRERSAYIITQCDAKALILHRDNIQLAGSDYKFHAELQDGLQLFVHTGSTGSAAAGLAYILYTSGSTGTPKGVMHTHEAALAFINWSSGTFHPHAADCFASHAPFHFDLSVFDLFVSAKHAARLVLIDEETAQRPLLLAKLISDNGISIWYSTPTILNLLAQYGKMQKYGYSQLRLVLFAGEVYPLSRFKLLKKIWAQPVYYNLYGPTETNVCTFHRIADALEQYEERGFPIGQCCAHYDALILQNEEDTAGQLCISGTGIMRGYWGLPDHDTEAFYTDKKNTAWYKTGDLVETGESGDLYFKGRADRMIKRNGYRIELAEVETLLHRHPGISACAALAVQDPEGGTSRICAFVSCTSSEDESVIRMKEYCMEHLPVYMIPDAFIFMNELPQTPSNKVDLQRLKTLIK